MVPLRRGAWLRVYGIPIHAWNELFFKLCVMECGTYLRMDDMSLDRGRFDYARILISTSSIEAVNCVDQVSIDGRLVDLKIVEEWGFNLGEDACLFEDEEDQKSISDVDEMHHDPETCRNVDNMVDKIVKDLEVEDLNTVFEAQDVELAAAENSIYVPTALPDLGSQEVPENIVDMATLRNIAMSVSDEVEVNSGDGENAQDFGVSKVATQDVVVCKGVVDHGMPTEFPKVGIEHVSSVSGPPFVGKKLWSGSWSTEWLKDLHGDGGLIFSAKRKFVKVGKRKGKCVQVDGDGLKRRKIGGDLRHTVHTLKKVTRLSSKDRNVVLHTLKKRARKRVGSTENQLDRVGSSTSADSSSVSVNKEWNHWVVLHGKEKEAVEDVWGIGKALGLQFEGGHPQYVWCSS